MSLREPGQVPPNADMPDRGRPPATAEQLALVSAQGWPALETQRLGGWLLQAADGFTGRANSVVPAADPGMPLDQALGHVQAFYARSGLPARIQVVVGSPLEDALRSRGWEVLASGKEAYATSEVRVAPLGELLARVDGAPDADVRLTTTLDDAWLAVYGRTTTPAAARHVLAGAEQVALARIDHPAGRTADEALADRPGSTRLVGIGRGVVTGPWLGISAVEVVPSMRRRGLALAIMAALGRWARDRGATWVYLQVGTSNRAARRLYDRLGFRTDHEYRYYVPPFDATTP